MSLRDLLVLYAILGMACAVAVLRRAPAIGASALASAVATVLVWPLWAPFALGAPAAARRHARSPGSPGAESVGRIERALSEAVAAVAGTPMSEVFSAKVAARIAAEVARVAARLDELSALTTNASFDAQASARRIQDLESRGASDRAVATARLQHESFTRLQSSFVGRMRRPWRSWPSSWRRCAPSCSSRVTRALRRTARGPSSARYGRDWKGWAWPSTEGWEGRACRGEDFPPGAA